MPLTGRLRLLKLFRLHYISADEKRRGSLLRNFLNSMKKTNTGDSITTYSLIAVSVLLFAYTFTRACILSITWDEAFSYLEFVRTGIVFPDKYGDMSANNHLLYTGLEIYLTHWLGTAEWVLRLPSLLAHILFLVYSAKLVKQLSNKWLTIAAFLFINLNPYVLDFFSLARGYGLSIGLMMTSIYYLYVFHKNFENKFAALSVFFAGLSVLANYVMLNYCIALVSTLVLLEVYHAYQAMEAKSKFLFFIKNVSKPVILFLLLLVFVLPIGLKLRAAGALFFGGNNGFWKDTVHTLIDRSLYELRYNCWVQRSIKGYVLLILIAATVFAGIRFFRKKITRDVLFLISSILLIGISVASTIAQHYLLGTLFLIDRTTLFLFVLFTVMLAFFLSEVARERKGLSVIAYASVLGMVIHFLLAFNLKYALEWKPDATTKEMLADLEKIKEIPEGKDNVSISIPLLFETDINFYRDVKNLTWLNSAARSKKRNPLEDYYYLSPRELAVLNRDSVEILKTYPVTGNVLARPRHKLRLAHIVNSDSLKMKNEWDGAYDIAPGIEFGRTISYLINDSLTPTKNAVIAFQAQVKTSTPEQDDFVLVICLMHGADMYSWDKVNVRDYVKKTDEWTTVYLSCIVPDEANTKDELKIYFWNRNKQKLSVKGMKFNWIHYTYEDVVKM
jgi:hypothetical protein